MRCTDSSFDAIAAPFRTPALACGLAAANMSDAEIANVIGLSVAGMAQAYGDDFALFDDALGGIFGL